MSSALFYLYLLEIRTAFIDALPDIALIIVVVGAVAYGAARFVKGSKPD